MTESELSPPCHKGRKSCRVGKRCTSEVKNSEIESRSTQYRSCRWLEAWNRGTSLFCGYDAIGGCRSRHTASDHAALQRFSLNPSARRLSSKESRIARSNEVSVKVSIPLGKKTMSFVFGIRANPFMESLESISVNSDFCDDWEWDNSYWRVHACIEPICD